MTSQQHPHLNLSSLLDQPLIQWPEMPNPFLRLRLQDAQGKVWEARLYRCFQKAWRWTGMHWNESETELVRNRLIVTVRAELDKTVLGVTPPLTPSTTLTAVKQVDKLHSHPHDAVSPTPLGYPFSCGVSLTTFARMASGKAIDSVYSRVEIEVYGAAPEPVFMPVDLWRAWLMDRFQFCTTVSKWMDQSIKPRSHTECCDKMGRHSTRSAAAPGRRSAAELSLTHRAVRAAALDLPVHAMPSAVEEALREDDDKPCPRYIYLGSHTDLDDDEADDAASAMSDEDSASSSSPAAAAAASSSSSRTATHHLYKVGMSKDLAVRLLPYYTHNPHFRFLTSWRIPGMTYAGIRAVEAELHALLADPIRGLAERVWTRSSSGPKATSEWFTGIDRATLTRVIKVALEANHPGLITTDETVMTEPSTPKFSPVGSPQKQSKPSRANKDEHSWADAQPQQIAPARFDVRRSIGVDGVHAMHCTAHLTYTPGVSLSAALRAASREAAAQEARTTSAMHAQAAAPSTPDRSAVVPMIDSDDELQFVTPASDSAPASSSSAAAAAAAPAPASASCVDRSHSSVLTTADFASLLSFVTGIRNTRAAAAAADEEKAAEQLKFNRSKAGQEQAEKDSRRATVDKWIQDTQEFLARASSDQRLHTLLSSLHRRVSALHWSSALAVDCGAVFTFLTSLLESPDGRNLAFFPELSTACAAEMIRMLNPLCAKGVLMDPQGKPVLIDEPLAAQFHAALDTRFEQLQGDAALRKLLGEAMGWEWSTPKQQRALRKQSLDQGQWSPASREAHIHAQAAAHRQQLLRAGAPTKSKRRRQSDASPAAAASASRHKPSKGSPMKQAAKKQTQMALAFRGNVAKHHIEPQPAAATAVSEEQISKPSRTRSGTLFQPDASLVADSASAAAIPAHAVASSNEPASVAASSATAPASANKRARIGSHMPAAASATHGAGSS